MVLIPLNQRIGTQVHVYKRKEGYFISIPLNPSFVIRMGPWNEIFMLFNLLKDNEVTKNKNLSSAHP